MLKTKLYAEKFFWKRILAEHRNTILLCVIFLISFIFKNWRPQGTSRHYVGILDSANHRRCHHRERSWPTRRSWSGCPQCRWTHPRRRSWKAEISQILLASHNCLIVRTDLCCYTKPIIWGNQRSSFNDVKINFSEKCFTDLDNLLMLLFHFIYYDSAASYTIHKINGGLILGSSRFSQLPWLSLDSLVKTDSKIIISICCWSESVTHSV